MIKQFQIQLANAKPITHEEYENLEDTSFHINNDPSHLNLKYKFYYSGREKKVGDIVLTAVLATLSKKENGSEEIDLKTITIHPDEVEEFELYKIQPTNNTTLLPVVVYKSSKEKKDSSELDNILDKVVNKGYNSLTQEEKNIFKKHSEN